MFKNSLVLLVSVSFLIFCVGIWGILRTRKNLIVMLIALELMLLSINLNFIIISLFLDDITGFIFSFFILAIAGAEACIGLSIFVLFFRLRGIISVNFLTVIKG